ncbi:hypothetical protein HDU87_004170 [Geranomyces variabilis]|uniref:Mediator of RNA polymerase II transcription subunit 20 n=1 Tax=Geranomyces variabilis TaxID=109894 RepID=A0AAD5XS50_9FUNG|nr:hypothetical protein HDU87_004170 [Geranomyces variabilis]
MGITCLLFLPTAPSTAIDLLNERLTDVLDFYECDELWGVTCRSYRDQVDARLRAAAADSEAAVTNYTPKVQYILSLAHVEHALYSMVATTGGRHQSVAGRGESGIVVELDKQFELILSKMKNLWTKRQELGIEGIKYQRGDYVIRIGTMKISARGSPGIWVQAENTQVDLSSQKAFQNLRLLLRKVLQDIAGIAEAEIVTGLHEQSSSTDAMQLDGPSSTVPPAEPSISVTTVLDNQDDWHEYAAVHLPSSRFTRSHEAYQFFRLFRQQGLL